MGCVQRSEAAMGEGRMSVLAWIGLGWLATAPVLLLVIAFFSARRTNRQFERAINGEQRRLAALAPTSMPRSLPR